MFYYTRWGHWSQIYCIYSCIYWIWLCAHHPLWDYYTIFWAISQKIGRIIPKNRENPWIGL